MSLNIGSGAASYYQALAYQSVSAKFGKQASGAVDVSVNITVNVTDVGAAEKPAERTVDDVKREFYEYLDSLPLSPGLSKTPLSVNITDAAFEKMLADPEYMQKMKDLCARDLCDPAWTTMPPTGINITIDADCQEEYLATSWRSPDGAKNVNENGFWTRRKNRQKADNADRQKRAQEKRAQEKEELMAFLQERAEERMRVQSEYFDARASAMPANAYAAPSASILE